MYHSFRMQIHHSTTYSQGDLEFLRFGNSHGVVVYESLQVPTGNKLRDEANESFFPGVPVELYDFGMPQFTKKSFEKTSPRIGLTSIFRSLSQSFAIRFRL
jgi:hypothetical protein